MITDSEALHWLNVQGRSAWVHIWLAVFWGGVHALVTIAMMYCLALALHAVVIVGALSSAPGWVPWAIPLCVLGRAVSGLMRDECGVQAGQTVRQTIRTQLLDVAWRGGPLWSPGLATGALSSVVTDQVDAIDAYFARYRPQRVLAAAVPLMMLIAVLSQSWMAALILLFTAPLIPVFMVMVGWRTRTEQSRQILAMQRLSGTFLDLVRGLPTLRLFDARQGALVELSAHGEEFRTRTMKVLRLAFLNGTVLEFFTSVAIALSAVYLGFSLLGYLDFGFFDAQAGLFAALFILLLAPEFYQPLRELGTHYHARTEAVAAAMEIHRVLNSLPEGPGQNGVLILPAYAGPADLKFESVGVAYMAGVPVLSGCTLEVRAGECVAVVGASGAGKSTLLRLAAGILEPDSGTLRVDGEDLRTLDRAAWREQIGWMDQHPPLLATTLAANLLAARSDAMDDELWGALVFAGLHDWAGALPDGLSTRLGEGGRHLSGGQLRRLALARLVLRRPRVLLLDEPSASLDTIAEAFVIDRLAQLRASCTTLLVTHRPAPLAIADRVLTLSGGRLLSRADPVAADVGDRNAHLRAEFGHV